MGAPYIYDISHLRVKEQVVTEEKGSVTMFHNMSLEVILANHSIHTSKELDFVSAGTVISACMYGEMRDRACVSFRT
jgi:hypothetical protein